MQGEAHLPVADSDINKAPRSNLGAVFLQSICADHFADFCNIGVTCEFKFYLSETAEPEFKLAVHVKKHLLFRLKKPESLNKEEM